MNEEWEMFQSTVHKAVKEILGHTSIFDLALNILMKVRGNL